jgi:hypothetical protein
MTSVVPLPIHTLLRGEEEPMQSLFSTHAARRGAVIALLAGCADGAQQSPSVDSDTPAGAASLAIGLYGMSGAPTALAGRACAGPEYRQFDFWLGTWEVLNPDETPAGTNIIETGLDGCAVMESYAFAGFIGRSLNSYDAATDQWHQHWSDNASQVIDLYGGSP